MSEHHNSFPSNLSSQQNSIWLTIGLFVITIHLALLGMGTLWKPTPPAPKSRSKVIVQTIRLKPVQSEAILPANLSVTAAIPDLSPPQEQPQSEPTPPIAQLLKEEIVIQKQLPLLTEAPLKEETPIAQEKNVVEPPKQETSPVPPIPISQSPSPPLHVKPENKPQSKNPSPKTPAQEIKKSLPSKKTVPVKKSTEPAKKSAQKESAKAKPQDELEKKQQQERIEAEKKRKQEQAETEKKQQLQLEAEKKRQQELAAAREAAQQREQALLTKAKENLAKMGETRDKISTSSPSLSLETTTLPKELKHLQVDALLVEEIGNSREWGTKEIGYSDEVASYLKMHLRLPDYGNVKIKLTMDRTGKVIKVETIQSESKKNKIYVESKIPFIIFPPFGHRFQGASQNTFVITLQNDS